MQPKSLFNIAREKILREKIPIYGIPEDIHPLILEDAPETKELLKKYKDIEDGNSFRIGAFLFYKDKIDVIEFWKPKESIILSYAFKEKKYKNFNDFLDSHVDRMNDVLNDIDKNVFSLKEERDSRYKRDLRGCLEQEINICREVRDYGINLKWNSQARKMEKYNRSKVESDQCDLSSSRFDNASDSGDRSRSSFDTNRVQDTASRFVYKNDSPDSRWSRLYNNNSNDNGNRIPGCI